MQRRSSQVIYTRALRWEVIDGTDVLELLDDALFATAGAYARGARIGYNPLMRGTALVRVRTERAEHTLTVHVE